MTKLLIGTKVYNTKGDEWEVVKVTRKYITIRRDYSELKCVWYENKLVYSSPNHVTDYRTKETYDKHMELQDLSRSVNELRILISSNGINTKKLRESCTTLLQKLDTYETKAPE